MTLAYIGLGSNLEGPRAQVERALARLGELGPLRASSLYRTEPLGPPGQPWYVNAVAELGTALEPHALLARLRALEAAVGRATPRVRWGPRVLDLDLLLAGACVERSADLVLPHPELLRRRFVLEPLCELAPALRHPVTDESLEAALRALRDPLCVERLCAPPKLGPPPAAKRIERAAR